MKRSIPIIFIAFVFSLFDFRYKEAINHKEGIPQKQEGTPSFQGFREEGINEECIEKIKSQPPMWGFSQGKRHTK